MAIFIGRKNFDRVLTLVFYIVGQILGAFFAVALGTFTWGKFNLINVALIPKQAYVPKGLVSKGYLPPDRECKNYIPFTKLCYDDAPRFGLGYVGGAEMYATFLFTLVILCISNNTTRHSTDGAFNGFIVCLTLYTCA